MRTFEILAVVAASTLLSACKDDNANVNLTMDAAVPPPPVVVDAAAPVPTPVVPPPTPVVTPPTTPKGTATTGAGTGTSLDAGASDAAAPTDAGAMSGKLSACFQKCQGILASCATPTFPADGGLPQIKDPKACEAAFETCRAACAP